MKVQFVINVPQTLALQDPSGEYNETYEEVSYPCVDGRILTVPTHAAERLNLLDLHPGESFGFCKRWERKKGTIPVFDFWLIPASEQARAAAEMAQDEAQRPASAPVTAPPSQQTPQAPRKRQKRQKVEQMPVPQTQPQLWDGRATGTYGPTPQPLRAANLRPPRIPYNVAFAEVVRFVTAGLKEAGEQWNDEAKQGMVSTVLISASREGLLQLWERP